MSERPKIVCLCGSTRFMSAFYDANMRETLAGRIVLTVGMSAHGDCKPTAAQKLALDALHFRKIEMADEILVLDPAAQVCPKCGAVWCKEIGGGRRLTVEKCGCGADLAGVRHLPYVGESTRNEIAHATKLGKPVRYLSREAPPCS